MSKAAVFVAALLALALVAPAQGQQIRFTGRTTVDGTVIRDALRQVMTVAAAREGCTSLSAVEASVMPEDYLPPAAYRVDGATRYERWDVAMCGRVVPFLLGFWEAPQGGMMFQVGYPFPEPDAPKRPAPESGQRGG